MASWKSKRYRSPARASYTTSPRSTSTPLSLYGVWPSSDASGYSSRSRVYSPSSSYVPSDAASSHSSPSYSYTSRYRDSSWSSYYTSAPRSNWYEAYKPTVRKRPSFSSEYSSPNNSRRPSAAAAAAVSPGQSTKKLGTINRQRKTIKFVDGERKGSIPLDLSRFRRLSDAVLGPPNEADDEDATGLKRDTSNEAAEHNQEGVQGGVAKLECEADAAKQRSVQLPVDTQADDEGEQRRSRPRRSTSDGSGKRGPADVKDAGSAEAEELNRSTDVCPIDEAAGHESQLITAVTSVCDKEPELETARCPRRSDDHLKPAVNGPRNQWSTTAEAAVKIAQKAKPSDLTSENSHSSYERRKTLLPTDAPATNKESFEQENKSHGESNDISEKAGSGPSSLQQREGGKTSVETKPKDKCVKKPCKGEHQEAERSPSEQLQISSTVQKEKQCDANVPQQANGAGVIENLKGDANKRLLTKISHATSNAKLASDKTSQRNSAVAKSEAVHEKTARLAEQNKAGRTEGEVTTSDSCQISKGRRVDKSPHQEQGAETKVKIKSLTPDPCSTGTGTKLKESESMSSVKSQKQLNTPEQDSSKTYTKEPERTKTKHTMELSDAVKLTTATTVSSKSQGASQESMEKVPNAVVAKLNKLKTVKAEHAAGSPVEAKSDVKGPLHDEKNAKVKTDLSKQNKCTKESQQPSGKMPTVFQNKQILESTATKPERNKSSVESNEGALPSTRKTSPENLKVAKASISSETGNSQTPGSDAPLAKAITQAKTVNQNVKRGPATVLQENAVASVAAQITGERQSTMKSGNLQKNKEDSCPEIASKEFEEKNISPARLQTVKSSADVSNVASKPKETTGIKMGEDSVPETWKTINVPSKTKILHGIGKSGVSKEEIVKNLPTSTGSSNIEERADPGKPEQPKPMTKAVEEKAADSQGSSVLLQHDESAKGKKGLKNLEQINKLPEVQVKQSTSQPSKQELAPAVAGKQENNQKSSVPVKSRQASEDCSKVRISPEKLKCATSSTQKASDDTSREKTPQKTSQEKHRDKALQENVPDKVLRTKFDHQNTTQKKQRDEGQTANNLSEHQEKATLNHKSEKEILAEIPKETKQGQRGSSKLAELPQGSSAEASKASALPQNDESKLTSSVLTPILKDGVDKTPKPKADKKSPAPLATKPDQTKNKQIKTRQTEGNTQKQCPKIPTERKREISQQNQTNENELSNALAAVEVNGTEVLGKEVPRDKTANEPQRTEEKSSLLTLRAGDMKQTHLLQKDGTECARLENSRIYSKAKPESVGLEPQEAKATSLNLHSGKQCTESYNPPHLAHVPLKNSEKLPLDGNALEKMNNRSWRLMRSELVHSASADCLLPTDNKADSAAYTKEFHGKKSPPEVPRKPTSSQETTPPSGSCAVPDIPKAHSATAKVPNEAESIDKNDDTQSIRDSLNDRVATAKPPKIAQTAEQRPASADLPRDHQIAMESRLHRAHTSDKAVAERRATDEIVRPKCSDRPAVIRFRKYALLDFHLLKTLGKGSFGKVFLVELRDVPIYFAMKCLRKDVVLEDDDVECTLVEREVLSLGSHNPFICKLFCTFQTESHLFFVMEFLRGGDLMFHVQNEGSFTEERARFYGAEIVCALKFLHRRGIVYRDLKLDNICLDGDGHIRLIDFGMCVPRVYRYEPTAFCGTPEYMAPEVIEGKHYNYSVDWWSFGVVMYEMLRGRSPYTGCDEDELFWNVLNTEVEYPKYFTRESKNLIQSLLQRDPEQRLGMPECARGDIRDHVFFYGIQWNQVGKKQLTPLFKPPNQGANDVSNFDEDFTREPAVLTPIAQNMLLSMDQDLFKEFSYTNPNMTS